MGQEYEPTQEERGLSDSAASVPQDEGGRVYTGSPPRVPVAPPPPEELSLGPNETLIIDSPSYLQDTSTGEQTTFVQYRVVDNEGKLLRAYQTFDPELVAQGIGQRGSASSEVQQTPPAERSQPVIRPLVNKGMRPASSRGTGSTITDRERGLEAPRVVAPATREPSLRVDQGTKAPEVAEPVLEREIKAGEGWHRAWGLYTEMEVSSHVPILGPGLRFEAGERLSFYLLYIGAINVDEYRALIDDLFKTASLESAKEGLTLGLGGVLPEGLEKTLKRAEFIFDILSGKEGLGDAPDREIELGPYRFKRVDAVSKANEQLYDRHSLNSIETQRLVKGKGGIDNVLKYRILIRAIVDDVDERDKRDKASR